MSKKVRKHSIGNVLSLFDGISCGQVARAGAGLLAYVSTTKNLRSTL